MTATATRPHAHPDRTRPPHEPRVVNLTEQTISLRSALGKVTIVQPSGMVAWAEQRYRLAGAVRGIAVKVPVPPVVHGVPHEVSPGVIYLVEAEVLRAMRARPDVYAVGEVVDGTVRTLVGAAAL